MKMRGSLALKLCLFLVAFAAAAAAATTLTLTASPSAVDFQYSPGEPQPLPVNVTIIASDGSSPVITVVVHPSAGAAATLFPQPPVTGDTIAVGYDSGTLNQLLSQPAIYSASLTVTASGFQPLTIPLTFSVGAAISIIASPTSLTFNVPGTTVQTVSLLGSGGAQVSYSVTSSTSGGGNWLSVSTTASYTPAILTVTVNPLNVPAGTYTGTITITPSLGGPLGIPVTLAVGSNTLGASPSSLAFAYTLAGTTPPGQVVSISSSLKTDTFTAQAASTGNWLLVNGVTTTVAGSLPAMLNVTVNPAGLIAGTYTGSITVTDAEHGSQVVAVTLVVTGISNVANPTSLMFVAEVNGAVPPAQPVAVNGFGSASYTATVTGSFISVSSSGGIAPATLNVTASPVGLQPGTYSGKVDIDLDTHIQEIAVTLVVSASPVLTASAGGFIFTYSGANGGGAPPTPAQLSITVSGGAAQSFTFATGLPVWLQINSGSTTLTTPDTLTLTVVPQSLATGTYLADVILTPTTAGGIPLVVPVLLLVSSATPVIPNPTTLTFSGLAGAGPQSKTLQVSATSPTAFSTGATTATGGNWLSVLPGGGTATFTYTSLTVTADATSLTAGTYQGTVTLTTAGGVLTLVPITFVVSSGNGPVTISPSTLSFAYAQNGTLPAAQNLQISGSQSFTDVAATSTGGAWLSVTPAAGAGNATLSVAANPAGLAPGIYNGSITVTPSGGVAQTVPVTLTVTTQASLAATPNPLAFSYTAGNPAPAAQIVSVTSSGAAVTFTATATSNGWLSVTPSSATTPASLSVSVNPASLGAGVYNGSIALAGAGGSVDIAVSLTVIAPLPNIDHLANSASYLAGGVAPGEIVTVFGSSLGPSIGVGAVIANGHIATTLANVQVTFNGYAAPILYASAGQINAIVPYELAGQSDVSVEVMFGSARSNQVALPVVSAAPGVYSANASGQGPGAILDLHYQLVSTTNPASAGDIIQVFATGQGQTSPAGVDGLIEPSALPLPAPLLSAAATIGGVAATIQYVGAAPGLVAGALQMNIVVPPGLPSGAAALFISFGGIDSSQAGITVAIQ